MIARLVIPDRDGASAGILSFSAWSNDLPWIGVRDASVSYPPIQVSGEVDTAACMLRDIADMKRIDGTPVTRCAFADLKAPGQ